MFEYHGWIKISESAHEAEDNSDLLKSLLSKITQIVDELKDNSGDVEVFMQNGTHYLRLHGDRNHYQSWVLSLFTKVGEIARGSYGLLYVRDDEDSKYSNQFQVWRMAKGTVSNERDQFLSPCNPVLET